VRKAVKSGTAAAVVAAVDIQHTNPCARLATQPGAEIAEICALAAAHNIPVVFALTRVGLGSIFGANKRMSGGRRCSYETGVEVMRGCVCVCVCVVRGGAGCDW
jgi:ribosomal protein L7Ae-like RNA K-turn-binding protein